jgi:REP element-mobilizing transposase RayT
VEVAAMPHSYTQLLYHIVFSTKHREPLLGPSVLPRLCEYLGGAVRGEGGTALIINRMPDHIHILARLRQDVALSDVLRAIKANSSGWVHDTLPELNAFAWQTGYGAFSVSTSQAVTVRRYIERQQEHHRRRTYQEEFVAFLKAHGIEYDERYLWE